MDYRRARQAGGIYFFTVVTHNRQPLLTRPENLDLLRQAVRHVKASHPFAMTAHVILPDHWHCLWRLPQGDDDYSTRWRLIKHFVSIHATARPFWQGRFWEHLIRDENDYQRHLDYIHYNPVRHGYAKTPGDWPHGSFAHYLEKGHYPPDWGVAVPEIEGEFGE
ncbi:MAG: transposase [Sulfurimicrobium sp.]|nr:transposase [Sulfurimicrobium sp.]